MSIKKILKKISLVVAILLLVIAGILFTTFNFPSNITYYLNRSSKETILIENSSHTWDSLDNISVPEIGNSLVELFSDSSVTISQLKFVRIPETFWQQVNSQVNPSYLNIFEFTPEDIDVNIYFLDDFEPTTAQTVSDTFGLNFCLNSSYFDTDNRPMGWIIKDGVELNRRVSSWRGYFFEKEGQVYFGPQSLLNETPGHPTKLCQAMPVLMKNGVLFDYINSESNPYFNSQTVSYRSLAGITNSGNIMFITSGSGGTLGIGELGVIAQKLDLKHATLFDGGKSLQYEFEHNDFHLSFHSFNNWLDIPFEELSPKRPPIYLGVNIL